MPINTCCPPTSASRQRAGTIRGTAAVIALGILVVATPAASADGAKALADACTTHTVARINALTGLKYVGTEPSPPSGASATSTACHYVKSSGVADIHALDLYVLVARGSSASKYYDGTVESWKSHPGYAPINGLGKRAVGTKIELAVDYGGLLIVVDDRGQATSCDFYDRCSAG